VHVQAIAATDATAAPALKTDGGDKPKPKASRGRNNSRGANRWSKVFLTPSAFRLLETDRR
jgi:hypothetical protein